MMIGVIFLAMLLIPNIIWSFNKPKDYDRYVKNENRILLAFERIGQILVIVFSLFFNNYNNDLVLTLIIAVVLMILYEMYWLRYFRSDRQMSDMYSDFLKIPLAGATIPVLAFFFLGIYGQNIFLIISVIVLAIGHIGIHLNHKKEINNVQ
ncbi:MAG: hypothetical protein E7Z79_05915 [Methanobrevibacter thaueri]|uniref:Uncharacterized protein n=1 Tax=Methanobrevibacter thaueri TaxID=190975 RepID=A0A8T3V5U3_9EURY|nr:hypothetical protein [Methanobrevibacter thaueri]MBE6501962.1 hypothetical protein [Methanobrevibacter thaueri]